MLLFWWLYEEKEGGCWSSRGKIFSHRPGISPILSIGRVVRILLREQKKRKEKEIKEKCDQRERDAKKKIFAMKSVAGENVIDSGART